MTRFERLMERLSPNHQKTFRGAGTEKRFGAGQTIVREGEMMTALQAVQHGRVRILTRLTGDYPIDVLGPGDVFGDISFLDGRTASASFLAEEDCRILVVDYATLEARMAASAEFRAAVLETLAHVMAERVRRYIDVRVADSLDSQRISNESPAWAALEKELSRLKSMLRAADLERGGSGDMPTPEKAAAVKDIFHTICTELHRLFYHDESITPTDRRRIGTYLQGEFLPLIRLSRTPDRIFEKPHGYALDSLMLQMMLDGEPSGSGRLGAAIDSAFLAEPACQGIRNRSRWLVHEVEEMCAHRTHGRLHVTSIASGTTEDLVELLSSPDSPDLKFTIIEGDPDAIEYLEIRFPTGLPESTVDVCELDILRAHVEQPLPELPPQHLVYSLIGFDCLKDDGAVQLLNWMYDLLAPGGAAVVGNFHPENPTLAFMEFLLDWKCCARNEEQLQAIFKQSKFGQPCQILFDREGMSSFVRCVK